MEPIKCNICRKTKPTNDFLKNGKTLKSCLACRDKNKTVKDPVQLPVKQSEPEPIPETKSEPILETKPEPVTLSKGWKILSGKWVKDNENAERILHQELTQKLIRQFKKKAALPVHQYLMKSVFADIRDL